MNSNTTSVIVATELCRRALIAAPARAEALA
jgi:hypothetical protein